MAYNQRIDSILSIISRRRLVTVNELKRRLGVSEVTIRKDLAILEAEGIVCRTHGGAIMAENRNTFRPYTSRISDRQTQKDAIAKAACTLVMPGDVIYIDAGTTCQLFAAKLRALDIQVQVVTNSIEVINELAQAESIAVFCPGGSYRREARLFIGPAATEALSRIRIKSCFMGTTGFSETGLFTSQNILEANLKKQIMQISDYRVVLADSSKYGVHSFAVFADAAAVDLLVTDDDFHDTQFSENTAIEVLFGTDESAACKTADR